jgi:hypothetical protein
MVKVRIEGGEADYRSVPRRNFTPELFLSEKLLASFSHHLSCSVILLSDWLKIL